MIYWLLYGTCTALYLFLIGVYYHRTEDGPPRSLIHALSFNVPHWAAGMLLILFFQLRDGGNWGQFIVVVAMVFFILGFRNMAKYEGPYFKRRFERKAAEMRADIARLKRR